MPIPIRDLPYRTDSSGLPASRIEPIIERVLQSPMTVQPTGVTRERYLDLMERIIRLAATWQDEHGVLIDPVLKKEGTQSSPRFVSSAAVLLHFGRTPELRENVYRGMDYCCRQLAVGQAQSPDFWMRELMTAWMMIADGAPAERRAAWERDLRSIDPEMTNVWVEKPDQAIESLHNWTVYAAAGEGLRELAGLGHADPAVKSGLRFWGKYMPAQLAHFTDDGMYRDPNDPFTYDMTTRLQFATPLAYGLTTSIDGRLHELLRRGALAELLYVSPDGYAPYGGRSAAMNFQECIMAAIGELEARRYRDHNPRLASAFKRHAHLGIAGIERWLAMTPHRHLKNGFDPATMHGCEKYAGYAVYSCFAASCLGLAALFADESIEEAATPAEIGGYVIEFSPAFHKVFAVCGGTQIEIDTAADPSYDATGLGRFHRAGVPLELGVAMPFTATPNYTVPAELTPKSPVAMGPAWRIGSRWVTLAELRDGLSSELRIDEQEAEVVEFTIDWEHEGVTIHETYTLTAGRLRVDVRCPDAEAMRMIVPMLETDGDAMASISVTTGKQAVSYRGAQLLIQYGRNANSSGEPIANRNGIYRPLVIERAGNDIVVDLSLIPSGDT